MLSRLCLLSACIQLSSDMRREASSPIGDETICASRRWGAVGGEVAKRRFSSWSLRLLAGDMRVGSSADISTYRPRPREPCSSQAGL